jgi:hypothetical protein
MHLDAGSNASLASSTAVIPLQLRRLSMEAPLAALCSSADVPQKHRWPPFATPPLFLISTTGRPLQLRHRSSEALTAALCSSVAFSWKHHRRPIAALPPFLGSTVGHPLQLHLSS